MKNILSLLLVCPMLLMAQKKGDPIGAAPVLQSVFINASQVNKLNIDSATTTYTDGLANFEWSYSSKDDDIQLKITNTGKRSFKILWQESGYVSPSGNVERVFLGGLKYFGRYSEQQPTRVFANTSITNKLAVFAFLDEDLKKVPILNLKVNTVWIKKDEYEAEALRRNFRFIIVIDSPEGIKEYDFHFGAKVTYKS